MKKIIALASVLFLTTEGFSQTSLTYQKNALQFGDSVQSHEFVYTSPGNDGANQIWDFSKIVYTSKNQTANVKNTPSAILEDVGSYNTILSESGYEYYFDLSESALILKGYTSADLSTIYTDPILKMKYPFAFGEKYTDAFAGHALFKKVTQISFTGDYTVSADAYGTLIAPDRTYTNVLRLTITKNSIQTNPCSTIKADQTFYYWYAEGYRYPVLTLNYKSTQQNADEPIIEKSGFYNQQQSNNNTVATGIDDQQNADFALNSYPNPFYDIVSYSYFLRKPMNVSIEFFDMSGKLNDFIIDNQIQTDGIHNGEVDAKALTLVPGVYYIRFTFDDKVIVKKVVKI